MANDTQAWAGMAGNMAVMMSATTLEVAWCALPSGRVGRGDLVVAVLEPLYEG
ncbi:MAG TPA: hypothetical protein VFB06_13035 [Streptosporangiaceae bacterium]|nr:hypothetical protein [Streptosporangiaceae bacterium]